MVKKNDRHPLEKNSYNLENKISSEMNYFENY